MFSISETIKKRKIDTYVFVLCTDLKKNVEKIKKLFDIPSFPSTFWGNYSLKTDFEKMYYTDKYKLLFYGINEKAHCSNKDLYETYGKIGRKISKSGENAFIILTGDNRLLLKNQILSYILGYYHFDLFKTGNGSATPSATTYFYHPQKTIRAEMEQFMYAGIVQNEVRSLINIPSNLLVSSKYAEYIKKNLPKDVKIKILKKKDLIKLGCNLLLAVNEGSKEEPMMIVLEYGSSKKKEGPVVLIGKGVMFDSGGYNLKGGDFSDMKNDMTGSAIVYGLLKMLSASKSKGHFIGLLPLVENMIGPDAIKPGDIVKSYTGKTVEITDTDAEGRLIIADALGYAGQFRPSLCIDIATLTGQAAHIFDKKSSIIMGNNNRAIQRMILSGQRNNERIWELPMWNEYVEMTKSNIADYKNLTYESRAGTIMAGAFLSNFVPENTAWIHLDIAGVDTIKKDTSMRAYGATGEIMPSVFDFLMEENKG